ncbi:histidine phosphatase superfamily-domain-containing protein [Scenedesmus sp. NREL 46B-D3]|nr:histidine phosphatase superfamily-domain-containing protein [Scenedesmus sp. NREL 46B-D3]
MTKVGQFFQQVLHLARSSSSSSSNKDQQQTTSGASAGSPRSSSTATAATPADASLPRPGSSGRDGGAGCSTQHQDAGAASQPEAPGGGTSSSVQDGEGSGLLLLDAQQKQHGTATTVIRESKQQQQQQQQLNGAAVTAGSHSAPLPAVPATSAERAAASAPVAAVVASSGSSGSTSGTSSPGVAAEAAAAPKAVGGGGGGVSFSPGSQSASATRAVGLSRRSMGALSQSRSLGGDSFKVRVGICAMDKKARSKPMREIILRLEGSGEFEVVNFGDELILGAPVNEWPRVDCLMSWYSDGFPLAKAQAYADATRPFLINDLHMQDALQDRREVYRVLQEHGIAVPAHIVVNRDALADGGDPAGFIEEEDYVELGGVRIDKPFVEKPASGEDHNIHIYYPHSMGGGVKRLFRKVDNKSSCYDPHHPGTVRRDGSYIYEEFLATGGTDVKVYTVGPRYAHAEARKSPVVDGRVLRSADGKEMRFPVLLNPAEKEISRTVCLAFGQKVCGFDLLRSEKGRSYVCDVNGWSFVKNSRKYYDDAAGILRSTILAALAPHRLALAPPSGSPLSFTLGLSPRQQSMAAAAAAAAGYDDVAVAAAAAGYDEESLGMMRKTASLQELSSLMAELSGVDLLEATRTDERSTREELRCVLAVVRHGDRTPKQKLKVRVRQPALLALFAKHADSKGKQAKLKSPAQLQELLDICRSTLAELEHPPPPGLSEDEVETREEQREKLHIVRTVLEQGGQFSGINRKVQLKPLTWVTPGDSQQQQQHHASGCSQQQQEAAGGQQQQQPQQQAAVGQDQQQPAQQHKQQLRAEQQQQQQQPSKLGPQQSAKPVLVEALLILKYGGVLTHAGRAQAEELGKVFRLVMYPRYGSAGGGLLRLHSTYRHDLKIYSSDEGRVQVSAAAFTKGLLALEGSSLTPILVSLVTKDASMLDAFGKGASEDIRHAKQVLYSAMTWDPATASSNNLTPNYSRSTTPLLTSPPMSPRTISRASSGGGGSGLARVSAAPDLQQQDAAAAAGGAAVAAGDGSSSSSRTVQAGGGVPVQAAGSSQDGTAAAAAAAAAGPPGSDVAGMPENPLQHLRRLNELMKTMVEQLRQLVLAEKRCGLPSNASSSAKDLTQAEAAAPAAPSPAAAATAAAANLAASDSSSSGLVDSMTSHTGQPLPGALPSSPKASAGGGTAAPSPAAAAAAAAASPQRPSTAPPGGAAAAAAGAVGAAAAARYSSLSQDQDVSNS